MGCVLSCLRNVIGVCDVIVDIGDCMLYVRSVWVVLTADVTFLTCREGCVLVSSMSRCLYFEHGRSLRLFNMDSKNDLSLCIIVSSS